MTKIRSQSSDLESAVLLVHHASEDVSSDEGSLDHVGDSSCAGLVLHAGGSILALHEVGADALHGSHAFGGSDDGLAVVNGRFVEGGTGHGDFLAVGNDDGGDHRSEGLGLLFPFADVLLHELGMSGLFGVTVGLSQSVSGSSDMDVVVSSCTVMFSSVVAVDSHVVSMLHGVLHVFFGESVFLGLAGFVGSSSVVTGSAGMASGSSLMGMFVASVSEFMSDVLSHSVDSHVSNSLGMFVVYLGGMVLSEVTLGDVVHVVLSGVESVVSVSNHVSSSSVVSLGLLSGMVSSEGMSGSSVVHSHLFDVTVSLVSVLVVSLVNNLLVVLFGNSFLSNLLSSFDGVLFDGLLQAFLHLNELFDSLVSLLSLSLSSLFVSHLAESMGKLEVGSSLLAQVSESFFGVVEGLLHLLFGMSFIHFLDVVSMHLGVV